MQRILVTGASGFLGSHIASRLSALGYSVFAAYNRHPERLNPISKTLSLKRLKIDLTQPVSIEAAFRSATPHAVVHAAAIADLSPCEQDKALAQTINTNATFEIAKLCSKNQTRLIFLSTDQVFDGSRGHYHEEDNPNPIHEYGRTKAEAEKKVSEEMPTQATVVRVALVYGKSPTGCRSCSEQVVNTLRRGQSPTLFTDEIRNPINAKDVASAITELISISQLLPCLHLGGPDTVSRYEIGITTAQAYGLESGLIKAVKQADLNLPTPRPPDLSLDTSLARKVLASPPGSLKEGLQGLAKADSP